MTTPAAADRFVHLFEPGTTPKAPPLLLLHGTGGDERDLLRLGRALSPGSAMLSPRGNVNEGGAARFFARVSEGVFDPVEVKRRTEALADWIEASTEQYAIEPSRLLAVGFSNGANIASALLQLRPTTLGGAVLIRPMVVLDQEAALGSLIGKHVLLLNGSVDPLVPPGHPPRLAALLRAGGATVTQLFLTASHSLTPGDVAAAQGWLAAL